MAGNESYINFDKVFSITPKPFREKMSELSK